MKADASFVEGVRGLTWLLAEAISVGLAAGLVALGPGGMARFVAGNVLPDEARSLLLAVALGFGAAGLVTGGLAWKRWGAAARGRVAAAGPGPARRSRPAAPRVEGLAGA